MNRSNGNLSKAIKRLDPSKTEEQASSEAEILIRFVEAREKEKKTERLFSLLILFLLFVITLITLIRQTGLLT